MYVHVLAGGMGKITRSVEVHVKLILIPRHDTGVKLPTLEGYTTRRELTKQAPYTRHRQTFESRYPSGTQAYTTAVCQFLTTPAFLSPDASSSAHEL